jgi:5-methylcytosine-specific restriction endonuclease McrA
MKHFDYVGDDFIPCECCQSKAVDVHHIVFKSQGGKDEIKNLMALCRKCHDKAHNEEFKESDLKLVHGYFMAGVRKLFMK